MGNMNITAGFSLVNSLKCLSNSGLFCHAEFFAVNKEILIGIIYCYNAGPV
jgi:hypothetical protein